MPRNPWDGPTDFAGQWLKDMPDKIAPLIRAPGVRTVNDAQLKEYASKLDPQELQDWMAGMESDQRERLMNVINQRS